MCGSSHTLYSAVMGRKELMHSIPYYAMLYRNMRTLIMLVDPSAGELLPKSYVCYFTQDSQCLGIRSKWSVCKKLDEGNETLDSLYKKYFP